jgi:hypothetical protein
MLAILTPGGVERMFVDSGVATGEARLPDSVATTPAGLEALTARYDVEHIGPPLGA